MSYNVHVIQKVHVSILQCTDIFCLHMGLYNFDLHGLQLVTGGLLTYLNTRISRHTGSGPSIG